MGLPHLVSARLLLFGLAMLPVGIPRAGSAAAGQDAKPGSLDPARPHGIAGVGGFKTISKVEFIGYPNAPHEWVAIYAYPDRARWSLRPTTGAPTSPMIVQRFGAQSWNTPAGSMSSRADDLGGPRTTLIQMELRRAYTAWPDGFAWSDPKSGPARAEIYALQHRKEKDPIGYLLANRDRKGRLESIQAFHKDDSAVEQLQVESWKEIEGRSWASQTLLLKQGKPVWRETLTYASSRGFHNDLLFTPPDRRESRQAQAESNQKIRHIDLPEVTLRLKKLKAGTSWVRAQKKFAKELKTAQKKLDRSGLREPRLETVPAFLLSSEGEPTHLLLRFEEALQPAPKGWDTRQTRPAVGTVLGDLAELSPGLLMKLRRALGSPDEPGIPYCRLLSLQGSTKLQVYLPAEDS